MYFYNRMTPVVSSSLDLWFLILYSSHPKQKGNDNDISTGFGVKELFSGGADL